MSLFQCWLESVAEMPLISNAHRVQKAKNCCRVIKMKYLSSNVWNFFLWKEKRSTKFLELDVFTGKQDRTYGIKASYHVGVVVKSILLPRKTNFGVWICCSDRLISFHLTWYNKTMIEKKFCINCIFSINCNSWDKKNFHWIYHDD